MTEEIDRDKQTFWELFEVDANSAVDDLFFKHRKLRLEHQALKQENTNLEDCLGLANRTLIKYYTALEEIKNCINTYCAVDNDFINSETYLRIMDELEVLK